MTRFLACCFAAVLAAAALSLVAGPASAQQAAGGQQAANLSIFPEKITEVFQTNVKKWEGALKKIAVSLFWLLVTIELAWGAGRLILRGADLSQWLSELASQVLFIGFFWALLDHSSEWAGFVIQSFQKAADQAAQADGVQSGAKPSDVFDAGLAAASKIMGVTSRWRPMDAVGLTMGAIVVMICFALMAAFMVVALVESYIVISAGVLFMGFGGSRWTKDYALAQVNYTMSVGAKLFIIQLIAALSQQVFRDLAADYGSSQAIEQVLLVIGASVIFFILMWTIPALAQGVLQGQSLSSPEQMTHAARELRGASGALLAAARKLAGGVIGGGKAVASAGGLASRQLQDPRLNTGNPGDGLLARTGRNLAGAAVRHAGARLGDWVGAGKSVGGQMSADMSQRSGGDVIDKKLGRVGTRQGTNQQGINSIQGGGQPGGSQSQPGGGKGKGQSGGGQTP
jgi:type IV secretion system protein TrbL